MAEKKPLKIRVRVTLNPPQGVELFIDEHGTVLIYRELGATSKAEDFVSLIQHICKVNKWRNRLISRSTKAKLLGLKRIYELPDPRQG